MESLLLFLQQMYDDMLIDVPLEKDSHSCAALLNLPLLLEYCSAPDNRSCGMCLNSVKFDTQNSSAQDSVVFKMDNEPNICQKLSKSKCHVWEIVLLQLTLIKMMFAKVQSQVARAEIKQKYLEIIQTLLKEENVDSKLICLLHSSDKQLSYMASKTLVSLVHFQLKEESSLNSAWVTFYLKALSGFPSNRWIAECLWTLTYMMREILKDEGLCKGGDLKKFLTPLDSVFESFYTRFMTFYSESPQDSSISEKAINDLSSFLDLLEILVTSRSQAPPNFVCQRMDSHFDKDRSALAGIILQFVNSGWLTRLSVSQTASHFGGSHVKPELVICHSPDQVTLRDVSLLLLKALEIKIQDSVSETEAQAHLESVMGKLLTFLKSSLRWSPSICPFEHPCMWLSVLFIEQDDDMLDAANSLLTIHLKFERFWREAGSISYCSEEGIRDSVTHQTGCNPHCIFLFLLSSIAFDTTVLLDFLISSETCFLEYFVRYLKLLVEDWQHFVNISKCFKPASSRELSISVEKLSSSVKSVSHSDLSFQSTSSVPQTYNVALLTPSLNISSPLHVDNQSVKPSKSNCSQESDNTGSLGTLQKLVDYESSDSDVEGIGEECFGDMKQTSLHNKICTGETVRMDPVYLTENSKQNTLPLDLNASPFHCKISPNNAELVEGVFQRSLKCFQQLQKSISRLHERNLFPYNPGPLLKLLTRINTISK
ncbi:protein Lines homolog 1 isoform X3 [Varanus komodoensis]|uniref:protein Lines homolog 1 isoform X3 n=1 Tax=Varanus komodoensis TaxID=61221 RepID=UPI001CF77E5B|nr:protein Lines homolog 1 isoform X3 [Varanus komodoensis]